MPDKMSDKLKFFIFFIRIIFLREAQNSAAFACLYR